MPNFKDVYKTTIYLRGFVLQFGKHKGKTVAYLMDAEPEYLLWCIENDVLHLSVSLREEFEQMNPWTTAPKQYVSESEMREALAGTNPNNGEAWE